MRRLRYSKEARADLVSIMEHFAQEAGSTIPGRWIVKRIREKCRRFASMPGMFGRTRPELQKDLRSFVVGRYIVFIRYQEPDALGIIAIVEGHRDIDAYFQQLK